VVGTPCTVRLPRMHLTTKLAKAKLTYLLIHAQSTLLWSIFFFRKPFRIVEFTTFTCHHPLLKNDKDKLLCSTRMILSLYNFFFSFSLTVKHLVLDLCISQPMGWKHIINWHLTSDPLVRIYNIWLCWC